MGTAAAERDLQRALEVESEIRRLRAREDQLIRQRNRLWVRANTADPSTVTPMRIARTHKLSRAIVTRALANGRRR